MDMFHAKLGTNELPGLQSTCWERIQRQPTLGGTPRQISHQRTEQYSLKKQVQDLDRPLNDFAFEALPEAVFLPTLQEIVRLTHLVGKPGQLEPCPVVRLTFIPPARLISF
jgi:hypothetical protein